MAYNVPAVYDVFASPIKEREAFQGLQKCDGEKPHKGALAPTGIFRSPNRLLAVSIYSPVRRSFFFFIILYPFHFEMAVWVVLAL
jgi:hypothetical protein